MHAPSRRSLLQRRHFHFVLLAHSYFQVALLKERGGVAQCNIFMAHAGAIGAHNTSYVISKRAGEDKRQNARRPHE